MNKQDHTSRTDAFKKDKEFYVDEDLGYWAVFGTETGFCYKGGMEKEEAKEYAKEMTKNKADHLKFQEALQ